MSHGVDFHRVLQTQDRLFGAHPLSYASALCLPRSVLKLSLPKLASLRGLESCVGRVAHCALAVQVSRSSGETHVPCRESLFVLQVDVQVTQEEPGERVRVEAAVELLGKGGEVVGGGGCGSGGTGGHLRRGEKSTFSLRRDPAATVIQPPTRHRPVGRLRVPVAQAAQA